MKKLKMGIIGVGGIAQERHIPAYLQFRDKVEIEAVHDVNHMRAKEVADRFDIPYVFKEYRDLLKKVDAVTICTPNKFHAEITLDALYAGVHVLCEKPMAITIKQCEEMIQASKETGKILSIGYHYRFTESAQLAHNVAPGLIGDPLVTRVRALRRRKVPSWGVFTNKDLQGGGSLIDFGCHFLDLALWILNNPDPYEVIGKTYNRLSKQPNQPNEWGTFDNENFQVDDHVSAYITFKDHSSMLFECFWAANIKEDVKHISISGANGGLNVFPYESYQVKDGEYYTEERNIGIDQEEAGVLQAKNFIESCLGEAELINKPEQALIVTRIISAIYKSCEDGTSVKIDGTNHD